MCRADVLHNERGEALVAVNQMMISYVADAEAPLTNQPVAAAAPDTSAPATMQPIPPLQEDTHFLFASTYMDNLVAQGALEIMDSERGLLTAHGITTTFDRLGNAELFRSRITARRNGYRAEDELNPEASGWPSANQEAIGFATTTRVSWHLACSKILQKFGFPVPPEGYVSVPFKNHLATANIRFRKVD